MKVIFKYPIFPESEHHGGGGVLTGCTLEAKVLSAQMQHGMAQIWVEDYPPKAPDIDFAHALRWLIVGTGQSVDLERWRYVATYQNLQFVWHVYWRVE